MFFIAIEICWHCLFIQAGLAVSQKRPITKTEKNNETWHLGPKPRSILSCLCDGDKDDAQVLGLVGPKWPKEDESSGKKNIYMESRGCCSRTRWNGQETWNTRLCKRGCQCLLFHSPSLASHTPLGKCIKTPNWALPLWARSKDNGKNWRVVWYDGNNKQ